MLPPSPRYGDGSGIGLTQDRPLVPRDLGDGSNPFPPDPSRVQAQSPWFTPGLGVTYPNQPQAGPNLGILQQLQDAYNVAGPRNKARIDRQMTRLGAPAQWPTPQASPLMPVSPQLFRGLPKPENPRPNNPPVYMQQLIDSMRQKTAGKVKARGGKNVDKPSADEYTPYYPSNIDRETGSLKR